MISVRCALIAARSRHKLTLEVARVRDDDGTGLLESVESSGHGEGDGRR